MKQYPEEFIKWLCELTGKKYEITCKDESTCLTGCPQIISSMDGSCSRDFLVRKQKIDLPLLWDAMCKLNSIYLINLEGPRLILRINSIMAYSSKGYYSVKCYVDYDDELSALADALYYIFGEVVK